MWERATQRPLVRRSPCGLYCEEIDRGVNFFVLALERLGAITQYSCEGHPDGFYVVFTAPYSVAQKIKNCGYFRVELEMGECWSIRLPDGIDESTRVRILTAAAAAWCCQFQLTVKKLNLTRQRTKPAARKQ